MLTISSGIDLLRAWLLRRFAAVLWRDPGDFLLDWRCDLPPERRTLLHWCCALKPVDSRDSRQHAFFAGFSRQGFLRRRATVHDIPLQFQVSVAFTYSLYSNYFFPCCLWELLSRLRRGVWRTGAAIFNSALGSYCILVRITVYTRYLVCGKKCTIVCDCS